MFDVDKQINSWKDYLRARGNFKEPDIEELENHLREEIDNLQAKGLSAGVAFFISVKRLGNADALSREFLIGFDVMLVLVLGLVLYVISARGSRESAGFFDYMNFALIAAALIIDVIALSAIIFRLSSFGASHNKIAALGENIVLLVNLAGPAFLYVRFFLKKIRFKSLEAWQTAYLPVYAGWAAVVIFLFPLIFGFR